MNIHSWWSGIDWDFVIWNNLTCVYDGPDYLMVYWLCLPL